MPLPTDEKTIALAEDLVQQLDAIFGSHPGFRPVHAKGAMLTGTFTPSSGAGSLTRAPHINRESTPVTVRFSDNTGIPMIPDADPNTSPRGCAIRFHLADRIHTDIIAHSDECISSQDRPGIPGVLARTRVQRSEKAFGISSEAFLGSHPAALVFVQAPKPVPSSFAREAYFGITAMRFTNKDGASRYGRYRIVPEAGVEYLTDAAVATKSANFLFDELAERSPKARSSCALWRNWPTTAMS